MGICTAVNTEISGLSSAEKVMAAFLAIII